MEVDRNIRIIGSLCFDKLFSANSFDFDRINRIYEYLGYSRKREQWNQDLNSKRIG